MHLVERYLNNYDVKRTKKELWHKNAYERKGTIFVKAYFIFDRLYGNTFDFKSNYGHNCTSSHACNFINI